MSGTNHAMSVTPSDTDLLPAPSEYLSFTNTGAQTLTYDTIEKETVTVVLPSGMYPLKASRVWATGTTVSNIVEFWD